MRALVVAPQPFFSPRGTPFSVYYRTLVAAQLGTRIDLLTYGQGQDVDIPGVRIVRIPAFALFGPVRIGPSPLKLFLDVVLAFWTAGLLVRHRYDFVHAHEEAVFWCRLLKPLFRFKLVYDMHSSLPQQLVNFNFTRSKTVVKAFAWLERACLRNAEVVITICPDLQGHALALGVPPARHLLIENSIFDDVRLKGGQAPSPAAAFKLDEVAEVVAPEGPIVAYAGTFEPYQGLDLLLSAFARLLEQVPSARLLLVGGTPGQVEQQRRLAAGLGIDASCIFTGAVSKARARALTGRADVLVSPRTQGTNTPLKIYELLASGKPLVATRIRSHTQVLNDEVCLLVEPSADAMAAGLRDALAGGERLPQVARARMLYDTHYSRPAYESKMQHLLERLS
jgi:glycosyltransferase involved in cell wall biosynthesis